MSQTRIVNCPNCDKEIMWSKENYFRPFCCERCRLIDFGEWATEQKVIAGESVGLAENNDEDVTQ